MSIWTFLLKVNGVDVDTYGLKVAELRGNWTAPSQSFDEVGVPDHEGPIAISLEPTLAPRTFVVVGSIEVATPETFETNLDTLKYQLRSGTLTIITGNQDARQRSGTLVDFDATPYEGEIATHAQVTLTIRCRDPIAYATSNTTVTGTSASDITCAVGLYKSRPTVTVNNPTSPLVLTYKNASGTTRATMTITFPGSPAAIVVDMTKDGRTVTVDGTRHDDYVTAGDFFALDPYDGDPLAGSPTYPTVRASSGSAVSIVYPKAWP